MTKNIFLVGLLLFGFFVGNLAAQKKINFVVIPDTQNNAGAFVHVFDVMFDWLAANASQFDFVLHVGDVVESSSNIAQWEIAKRNFNKLNTAGLPYAFCLGNHDTSIRLNTASGATCDVRVSVAVNNAFPASSFSGLKGVYEPGKIDNSYYVFEAGGKEFLVVSLEHAPNDAQVAWANSVINANPDKLAILLTHNYLAYGSIDSECAPDAPMTTINWRTHAPAPYDGGGHPESVINTGEMLWNKLVRKHKNMFATFSGHVLGTGTGKQVAFGDNGNKVYSILQNYQNQVQNLNDNGENGYLRIVTIDTEIYTMEVRTYSPFLGKFYPTNTKQNFRFCGVDLDSCY